MIAKFACVAAILTVASVGQANAGGLLGGILSNNGILNGNKTGILNGVLNGNKTSVDVIDNKNDGGKKRRH